MKDYQEKLAQFIKFKSISTDPDYKQEINNAANWLESLLESYRFQTKLIYGQETNPYVYGEYAVGEDKETILIYGHYDVQPVNDREAWKSSPFDLTGDEERFYGRGVVDNKGQLLIHLITIGNLIKAGELDYNVKFFVEGNEETGNLEIAKVIEQNKDLLSCDYVLLSDGELAAGRPTIDVSFRGGINLTLEYKSADNNLHSGIYGGAVPNPVHELGALISKFYNQKNQVAIQGFYDDVNEITEEELNNNQSIPFNLEDFKNDTGIKQLKAEPGYDFYTQTGLRPMLTITGFKSGYIDEGYSNIVPSQAEARINFRLVTDQNPQKVVDDFQKFVNANTPTFIEPRITNVQTWKPIRLNVNSSKIEDVKRALEKVYQKKIVYKYVGGSIPVVVDFKEILGKEVISISLANEDCNMHGVDENFRIDLIKKGLEFSRRFFSRSHR